MLECEASFKGVKKSLDYGVQKNIQTDILKGYIRERKRESNLKSEGVLSKVCYCHPFCVFEF